MTNKLSTDPYKGVRDFYPEDQAVQNYIFDIWKSVAERYGYEEYNASILEPAELYSAKTNEEHVSEQTYTFTDRGDRQVTLRPEMTPTVARMIAARKRDLAFPIRWYSIPNVFRYERPQRGRLREHWQLNVDTFGSDSIAMDTELVSLAYDIMNAFGAQDNDFVIKLNHRGMFHTLFTDCLAITDDERRAVAMLIDRRAKMEAGAFETSLRDLVGGSADMLLAVLNTTSIDELMAKLPDCVGDTQWLDDLRTLRDTLAQRGITNVVFDPTLMRGFDYYTGMIFEVFDTSPENNRSLFGGGRYDRLLELFSDEKVPAVGFGMGDVTIRDFLETHKLLPELRSTTDVMTCVLDDNTNAANKLADELRRGGINVAVYHGTKKLGDQIKIADKKKIPYVAVVGNEEAASQQFKLKNLATGDEQTLDPVGIVSFLKDVRR